MMAKRPFLEGHAHFLDGSSHLSAPPLIHCDDIWVLESTSPALDVRPEGIVQRIGVWVVWWPHGLQLKLQLVRLVNEKLLGGIGQKPRPAGGQHSHHGSSAAPVG